ncbi:uncharacterized protein LOC117167081 [Belonocnema kinseyi]|uniref:uncharacterized protein LOC117167081 n=1 Tax=Belonocnema kinseyi TaxID=2817044 RepID=UPI00143CD3EC|nr:uncharacterized protein LOC117167081 [Belonocnema kinseyi]
MSFRDQSVHQDETWSDGMIDIKVEQISLSEDMVDVKREQSSSNEMTDDDFTCEHSAFQLKEPILSPGTENIPEHVRRGGRLPSTLPTPNRNAEKARAQRKRKREYKESLEKQLVLMRKKNEEISNVVKKEAADIILLKLRITELHSVFDDHPRISKVLNSLNENSNMENTTGTYLHVSLKKDLPELCVSSQISRWNSEKSLLDEFIDTEPDASYELAVGERRESNTLETEFPSEGGIQSTSKLHCLNERAQKARENRQKRKAYMEKLEKELYHIEKQNGHNSKVVEKLKADIMRSRAQVAYLESVLNNHARISAVLKSMNVISSDDNLRVESFNAELDDPWELSAKRRKESNISTETDVTQEGVRRRGRLPTTLPATNSNAKKARQHRIRQREYLQNLEKELELAKKKKKEIINDIKAYDIRSWRGRVADLKTHFEQNPSISALLKLINANRSHSFDSIVGICLHITRSGVLLELCAFCQGKSLKTEEILHDKTTEVVLDAEPESKRKSVLSSISTETSTRQERVQRRGRLPSILPAPTSNAKEAREIRERKKQYLQTLEKEFNLVKQKSEDINSLFNRQGVDIMRMKSQVAYLEGVRDNQPGISKLLKFIDAIKSEHDFFQCRKNTAGFCLHVNGNKVSLEFCAPCHMKSFKGI